MKRLSLSILTFFMALLLTLPSASLAATTQAQSAAQRLYDLGLFLGTGDNADGTPNFALEQSATRVQAIVMLIRLLGREEAALSGGFAHPFSDVPAWADGYVGYAYESALTTGQSATLFGSDAKVTANDYVTFLLRALGYSDAKGDFSWRSAALFAAGIGMTDGSYSGTEALLRADAALLSSAALDQPLADGSSTLLEALIAQGAVDDPDGTDGSASYNDLTLSYIDQIVTLVNARRAEEGLSPVTLDWDLTAAAMTRAAECQTLFSHTRPAGTRSFTALDELGIVYRAAAENIAYGQLSPSAVMTAWMNSSGHRKNIMNSAYSRIGVGFVIGSNGVYYWSQFFCN